MTRQAHWETVYANKSDAEVSWTQAEPRVSLELIRQATPSGSVIDVGGGSSVLAERLVEAGYGPVAVLDISAAGIERARARAELHLGARADRVRWIVGDVTAVADVGRFDVWHDRATFHFLTDAEDRKRYAALLSRTVPVGGHAIIATFALDGPPRCSGLDVLRYDGPALAAEFSPTFELVRSVPERHVTPWGAEQSFQYSVLRRLG